MNLEKTIVVIVLYRSSLENSGSFQSLLTSIKSYKDELTLVVYNNSPGYWEYNHDPYDNIKIIYIRDSLNSGVSKAYNKTYLYAKRLNKEYILLLDQDTLITPTFFSTFFEGERKYKSAGIKLYCPIILNKNQLISPARFFLFTARKIRSIISGEHSLKELAIINSGLIIATDLFESVGGYNEKIKLDFSDFDFLRRSLKFTNKIVVLDTICQHSLTSEGEVSLKNALNRFDYYLKGAFHYKKSFIEFIGLSIWIPLRSIKLNLKYGTIHFSKRIIQLILKRA